MNNCAISRSSSASPPTRERARARSIIAVVLAVAFAGVGGFCSTTHHIGSSGRFMMKNLETLQIHFEAGYLLHVPERVNDRTLLILTLHGYGSHPEAMLRLTLASAGEDCIIASLRGPNQFYSGGAPGPNESVAYNWGTRFH